MLTNVEEQVILYIFGHNPPIVSIDGYDGTVHRGPFQLSRDLRIVMDGHDLIHR